MFNIPFRRPRQRHIHDAPTTFSYMPAADMTAFRHSGIATTGAVSATILTRIVP
jgi:hypothetical protein